MEIISLSEIKNIIKSGSLVAIGGFTINRKPISIINEIINSDIKDLHIYTLGGAMEIDLLLKKEKIKKITAAYVGYEGLGISDLFRNFVENKKIEFEDLTEILYYFNLKAAAEDAKFIPTESIINSDIFKINKSCVRIKSLDSEKEFCGIKAICPDFCIIHAQKADEKGNIFIDEPNFSELEMAKASKITIISVEKIEKNLENSNITIPHEFIDYIILAEKGAFPTGCYKFYPPNISKIMEFLKNEKN